MRKVAACLLSACGDDFGFQLSFFSRLLHTHSTFGEMPTDNVVIVCVDSFLKGQQPMRTELCFLSGQS